MLKGLGGPIWDPLGTPLGRILGPSWAILGRSWGHLGPSRGRLGAILRHLGVILGHLGTILGHLGPTRPQDVPKMALKRDQDDPRRGPGGPGRAQDSSNLDQF